MRRRVALGHDRAGLPVVGNRLLLAGGVAELINPRNGEGIQYAQISDSDLAGVVPTHGIL